MAAQGVFITVEGLDGCGKTTQLHELTRWLQSKGIEPVIAQEPGGTRIGAAIRQLLLDDANKDLQPMPELLLYFASRAQNIAEVIRPALDSGRVVLSDRFTDATLAYQGYGRGLGVDAVRAIEKVACGDLRPDLTLLLEIEPEVALQRARQRNVSDSSGEGRMEAETAQFFDRVHAGYQALADAEPARIKRIDAGGGVEEVGARVRAAVSALLKQQGSGESATSTNQ